MCNPSVVRLLQRAKKMFELDQVSFICHALDYAGQDLWNVSEAYDLKRQVMHHLRPFNTYGCWLKKSPSSTRDLDYRHYHQGRRLWLDRMIEAAKKGEQVPPPPTLDEVKHVQR